MRAVRRDVDHHAVHELELFMDNDSDLYRQKDAFLANAYRKMKAGRYDPTLAIKLWMHYVDRGAKAYAKEYATPREWSKLFPKDVRTEVAKRYEKSEREALQRGEYSKYVLPARTSSARDVRVSRHTSAPASLARTSRDAQKERVWLALQHAAERIGRAEHAAGRYKVTRRKGRAVQGYTISEAHRRVIDTMNKLGADKITPEQAMAVLHEYDIFQARSRSRR